MLRKLPIAVIAGIDFYVDSAREELRQADNPQNKISFTKFQPCSKGFRFIYNKKQLGFTKVKRAFDQLLKNSAWVRLPALMELDPEGISLRYGIPLDDLCPETMAHPPGRVIADIIFVSSQNR